MVATALDLSQIKTDALSSAATFRSLIELGSTDTPTFAGGTFAGDIQQKKTGSFAIFGAKDNGTQSKVRIDGNTESVSLSSTTSLGWSSTNYANNAFDDLILERDAANTLAQRNGTNANEYRVYNTFTDASNYERGFLKWDANVFKIGTEAAGTGVSRSFELASPTTITGGTVTTSTPVLNATQTWNDAAVTFTAMKMDVTDTASAADSKLLDLQVGGTSEVIAKKNGDFSANQYFFSSLFTYSMRQISTQIRFESNGANKCLIDLQDNNGGFKVTSGNTFSWASNVTNAGTIADLYLARDAAGTLAQRYDTNAQTYNIYNTYTDASNYERAFLKWDSNVFKIGTEAAGTGVSRSFELASPTTITGGTVTASTPVINATQTWNDAAVTFTGMKLDVTDTASAADSLLMDLQVGGASKFSVDKNSVLKVNEIGEIGSDTSLNQIVFKAGHAWNAITERQQRNTSFSFYDGYPCIRTNSQFIFVGYSGGVYAVGTSFIGFSSAANFTTADVKLYRDAANTLAQRNGTNAQEFRLYNTYTDASNYERGFLKWDGNVFTIGTEALGTGLIRRTKLGSGNNGFIEIRETTDSTAMIFGQGGSQKLVMRSTEFRKDASTGTYNLGNSTYPFSTVYSEKNNQSTSSAADPSTTEYPNDGDHGIHKNTTSGNVFLAYNDGGSSIVKVQLS